MESFYLTAFLVLAGLAVAQSLLVTLQTWEHRRYVRSCMTRRRAQRPAVGHAAVFVPCKGHDVDLRENLAALFRQDYDDYDVTFIVESEDDPACETIRRVMAEHPGVPSRLVVAGCAIDTGQKVHNLRVATADLGGDVDYLAFVDSDAAPRPQWLRSLVRRLAAPQIPVVTGYRWFVPTRRSLPNGLLTSVNCGVMAMFGRQSHYLVWGGCWGIRRKVFEAIGLHAAWDGTLSDDLVATRQLRRAKVPVGFEPMCLVASPMDYSWRQMFEFIRRQYVVARFYTPDWWAFAVATYTFSNLAWLVALFALAAGLLTGVPAAWIPLGTCGLLYVLSVFRGLMRQSLVQIYFPQHQAALRAAGRVDVWAGPIVGLVNWLGVLGSLAGKHIHWRAIRYRLAAGGKIETVRRLDDAPPQKTPYRLSPPGLPRRDHRSRLYEG